MPSVHHSSLGTGAPRCPRPGCRLGGVRVCQGSDWGCSRHGAGGHLEAWPLVLVARPSIPGPAHLLRYMVAPGGIPDPELLWALGAQRGRWAQTASPAGWTPESLGQWCAAKGMRALKSERPSSGPAGHWLWPWADSGPVVCPRTGRREGKQHNVGVSVRPGLGVRSPDGVRAPQL